MVARDHQITQKLMVDQLHINQHYQILQEDLGKRKVYTKFIPHSLTSVRKELEITSCKDLIQIRWTNPHCLICIMTGDEFPC
jgi:hypothetical protein